MIGGMFWSGKEKKNVRLARSTKHGLNKKKGRTCLVGVYDEEIRRRVIKRKKASLCVVICVFVFRIACVSGTEQRKRMETEEGRKIVPVVRWFGCGIRKSDVADGVESVVGVVVV